VGGLIRRRNYNRRSSYKCTSLYISRGLTSNTILKLALISYLI